MAFAQFPDKGLVKLVIKKELFKVDRFRQWQSGCRRGTFQEGDAISFGMERAGNQPPHLSRGTVGDNAHVVDGHSRRAAGDQDAPALTAQFL